LNFHLDKTVLLELDSYVVKNVRCVHVGLEYRSIRQLMVHHKFIIKDKSNIVKLTSYTSLSS